MPKLAIAMLCAIGACGRPAEDKPAPPTARASEAAIPIADAAARDPADAPESPDAAPIDLTGSPEELWASYRAVVATATPRNFAETGRKLWPLLAGESREAARRAATQLIARARTKVSITADELALRLLGDGAWERAYQLRQAELHGVVPDANGTHVELRVYRPGLPDLELSAVHEGNAWLLLPGRWLVIAKDLERVMREPEGREAPVGSASVEDVAARWRTTLEKGTGWDAYNLLSPARRSRMHGEPGEDVVGDLVEVLTKTIVDRRKRGIHVGRVAIEDATAEQATLVFTYSNAASDRFVVVHADGLWWLELPI